MAAAAEPEPRLKVNIKAGPHGRSTELYIDGVKVKGACSYTLHGDVNSPTNLTVTYIAVDAEVEALVETTEFQAQTRSYKPVIVRPVEADDTE